LIIAPKPICIVGLVERLHAAELLRVLGVLLHDGVDHVIDRHDADHPAGGIHHRDGQQVIPGDETRHVRAVGQRRHGHRLARRPDGGDAGLRVAEDELAERQGTGELMVARIHDIDGIDRLAGGPDRADMLQGARGRPIRWHADEFRGHDSAGASRRIG
jgi:hypothetical protein